MNLEEYIDYPEERDTHEVLDDQEIVNLTTNLNSAENKSDEEDDSTEMCSIIHQEALTVTELIEQYIMQQDISETAQFEYDEALLKLQKEIRKLRKAAFKQTNIETYFIPEI
ncbi:16664_t:CDS:1 [Cetraspora pellucida]|uniref:16664_t:CDS:1 n=1 Tax=Cetraspora pellucida TaxID=1433469 RepID=A0A9N9NCM9_9GLOM|nr:16664_t:CDS:1 [Cetraspora pellucida]